MGLVHQKLFPGDGAAKRAPAGYQVLPQTSLSSPDHTILLHKLVSNAVQIRHEFQEPKIKEVTKD